MHGTLYAKMLVQNYRMSPIVMLAVVYLSKPAVIGWLLKAVVNICLCPFLQSSLRLSRCLFLKKFLFSPRTIFYLKILIVCLSSSNTDPVPMYKQTMLRIMSTNRSLQTFCIAEQDGLGSCISWCTKPTVWVTIAITIPWSLATILPHHVNIFRSCKARGTVHVTKRNASRIPRNSP